MLPPFKQCPINVPYKKKFFFFIYIHTSNLQKRKRLYKTQYPTIEHPNGGVLHTKTQKNISRTDRKKEQKWQRRHEKDVLHEWSIKSLG